MRRDSVSQTFVVAAVLCVACSVLVSAAAVGLRPMQNANKDKFQKKNILMSAGLYNPEMPIDAQFENIEMRLIDIDSGKIVDAGLVDPETYDAVVAAKDPAMSVEIAPESDWAGIKRRAKYAKVYLVRDAGKLTKVILPVHGKGLWSTLYGFLALEPDLNTVAGLTFYQHGETPGLGGEVDNPSWKQLWPGKKLYSSNDDLRIEVVKGKASVVPPGSDFQVDGLSGATITSRGVSNLIRFWVSEQGFGPFLNALAASEGGDHGQ